MTKKIPAAFLGGLVLLCSCSRTEPAISYGILRLVYFEESRSETPPAADTPEEILPPDIIERYSFFIIPEDEDGLEDLDRLELCYDREGLIWSLSSEDWISLQHEGQTWIGSRSIAMTDGETLPRGQFRAVLTDKGGERSERLFTFDAPAETRFPFPFCVISDGSYRIESRYPDHYFICYDGQGAVLNALSLNSARGDLAELELPPETRGVALWADDPEYSTAALTGVVSLR
ncbi:MAG: hypothetical protein LBQ14_01210 [Treponema sp.]|jgi:hypothetical protein|nr:hypothetical protein [Treponema sp.]